MPEALVTFRTCHDVTEVEAVGNALTGAGIPFRTSSNAATSDFTALGQEHQKHVVISLRAEDMAAATKAVAVAEEEAFDGVPDDHYFRDYNDYELGQVLASDFEWNAHEVACARALLRERNALPSDQAITEARDKYLAVLREGKQSSRILLIFGFLLAIFGGTPWGFMPLGVISSLMGWSFLTMKKTDPLGATYFVYNAASRKEGRILAWFSIASIVLWALVYLGGLSQPR